MSYAILDGEGSELSAAHNKVVGIVNAPEEFQNLQECFQNLLCYSRWRGQRTVSSAQQGGGHCKCTRGISESAGMLPELVMLF